MLTLGANKRSKLRQFIIAGLFTALPATAQTLDVTQQGVEKDYDFLQNLYVDLHQNPELSFHEKESAARMSKELRALGFDVATDLGGHGIVGVLKNGEGPTVMIRADMDALPVKEQTNMPWASTKTVVDDAGKTVNVMHACGHDVHMTVFVGAARRLAAMKDQWNGTLVLVGQPAEERGAGAKAMLNDGIFERFPKPDYNLAMHVSANLPAGKIAYTSGYAMANVDSIDVNIHGVGGHGAYPHKTKDPVVLAAHIITSLQTIVSRETSPLEPAVITVGSIHGGTKHNVISSNVKLELTIRSYTDEKRAHLIEGIKRVSKNQALAFGLPEDKLPEVTVLDEHTPALFNNPELVKTIMPVIEQAIGEKNVQTTPPVMAGEDFSRYGRTEDKIPGVLMWLGAVDPKTYEQKTAAGEALPSLHSAFFAPKPEPTIKTGVVAMTEAALHLFNKQ